ncbi:MAG: Rieske (2Fe-2S) protein, partial [Desulfatibacillaceae bacterium]|nr:Rieske (2Fe-2S) protein [Desulfatibacillaceae bacterium]
ELDRPGGALRVEGGNAPFRLLVIRDDEGQFRAFENRCSHLGHRRMDPVPGAGTIQCCSVNKSTYGYDGKVLSGPAPKPLTAYKVEKKGNTLVISSQ